MDKHTKGQWYIDEFGDVCANGEDVARIVGDYGEEECHANARLIAASPELLRCLVEAENALADYIPTLEKAGAMLGYGHSVLRQVRFAIAKARGEA